MAAQLNRSGLMRGVATYALELLRGVADLDTVYVPIGLGSGICSVIAVRDALGLKTRVVGVVAEGAQAYALSAYHTVGRLSRGAQIGAESSTNKIFWSELDLRMHETAMRILGARGELTADAPAAVDAARWLDGFLFAQAGPIYAGTNEIQRNIIAERMLGLPK